MTAAQWWIRAQSPERTYRDVLAWHDLGRSDQRRILARAEAGLCSGGDANVRGRAWRIVTDIEVASWGENALRLSQHIELELAALAWRGRPLERRVPVPGCSCWRCTGIAPAPRHEPDTAAITCTRCHAHRELVRDATSVWYQCMDCGTRSASAWPHSAVGSMLDRLPRVLVVPRPRRDLRPTLDVDAARAVPITEVARWLGLELDRRRKYARCPFHDDAHPSLHLNDAKRAAFCNPCGRSWDAIALVMEVRRVTFVDAVRELTAGRAA